VQARCTASCTSYAPDDDFRRKRCSVPKQRQGVAEPGSPTGPWDKESERTFGWRDVDAATLAGAVAATTVAGCGIVLGTTTDGGAISICVLDGERRPRIYAADAGSAEQKLRMLTEWALDRAMAEGRV
jgi:hypothetical protein